MSVGSLREQQMVMARYLRDPRNQPAPEGVEERRLKIYRDLVYNNIEGFISNGFPVLRSLYDDDDWHGLVRLFIDQHRCRTPYFLEISQEFLKFVMESLRPRPCDPPFIVELAHYEWVELALDVSEEEAPGQSPSADPLASVPRLSPLAWVLAYQFPVHRIGPDQRPEFAEQPTYLAVYRDREDRVQFMELNAATARLLELVRDNHRATGTEILRALAGELGAEEGVVLDFGASQLVEFVDNSVVYLTKPVIHTVAPGVPEE
jgi:hypothetical protein